MNKKYWSKKLIEEAWAYKITWKTNTWITPFELVYGKKSMLPIEFEYHTLRTKTKLDMNLQSTQREILIYTNYAPIIFPSSRPFEFSDPRRECTSFHGNKGFNSQGDGCWKKISD
jgi:hypothetical protein